MKELITLGDTFWLSLTSRDTSYMSHILLWANNSLWTILPLMKTIIVVTQETCGRLLYGWVIRRWMMCGQDIRGRVNVWMSGDVWTCDVWRGNVGPLPSISYTVTVWWREFLGIKKFTKMCGERVSIIVCLNKKIIITETKKEIKGGNFNRNKTLVL